jgi:acetyl-CoA carboxylase biotin carboxyl carrier protein
VVAPPIDVQGQRELPGGEKQPEQIEAKKEYELTSPMVGTYYAAPSPDDAPFVKVGDKVDEGAVVCIIEAMKVMNEVKAGKSGIVKEIFLDSADPVEFGTKLLTIS